jgi:hypothetical protein
MLAGYATAVIVDSTVLAWEPAARAEHPAPTQALRWTPLVSVTPKGASAGVGAVF